MHHHMPMAASNRASVHTPDGRRASHAPGSPWLGPARDLHIAPHPSRAAAYRHHSLLPVPGVPWRPVVETDLDHPLFAPVYSCGESSSLNDTSSEDSDNVDNTNNRRHKNKNYKNNKNSKNSKNKNNKNNNNNQNLQNHNSHFFPASSVKKKQNKSLAPSSTRVSFDHKRIMSHPFPAFFSLRKKVSRTLSTDAHFNDSDDSDDLVLATSSFAAQPRRHPPQSQSLQTSFGIAPTSNGPVVRSKGLAAVVAPTSSTRRCAGSASKDSHSTGHCMTCASTLRWPVDVKVFKCTKCMTIIDLEQLPAPSLQSPSLQLPPPVFDRHQDAPRSPESSKVSPISLDYTKSLARLCLKTYLTTKISSVTAEVDETANFHDTNPFKKRPRTAPGPKLDGATTTYFDTPHQPTLHHDRIRPARSPGYNTNPFRKITSTLSQSDQVTTPLQSALSPFPPPPPPPLPPSEAPPLPPHEEAKRIFKPLEDYIVSSLTVFECINASFRSRRPSFTDIRGRPEPLRQSPDGRGRPNSSHQDESARLPAMMTPVDRSSDAKDPLSASSRTPGSDLDPRLLLLGDVAENGLWWTGEENVAKQSSLASKTDTSSQNYRCIVNNRSPCIDWVDLDDWYGTVINVGEGWEHIYESVLASNSQYKALSVGDLHLIATQIKEAQLHTRRMLLKATEMLLKRPGRVITEVVELRFLIILLANPLLHGYIPELKDGKYRMLPPSPGSNAVNGPQGPISGHHSGIIKRLLGLMSNVPVDCHKYLTSWFSRLPDRRFRELKDLVGSFITYRLTRQHTKEEEVDVMAGLIPDIPTGRTTNAVANLHAALAGPRRKPNRKDDEESHKKVAYDEDWQIIAAARVMSLIFTANNSPPPSIRKSDAHKSGGGSANGTSSVDAGAGAGVGSNCGNVRISYHGQRLPTSDFYNSLLDYSDLISDFDSWESRRSRFSFCQYPFLLSIWAKIKIMEHDARRQMQLKAREAFFDSIMTRKQANQWLVLKVRRDCLVEDSLKSVSEVVGSGSEDIKKALKIDFVGEEGVDHGGLRKEWFQLLIREVFHPDHGMFTYDEDSQYCYFNPHTLETSDQFFLVGVVLGLAIYNGTILDVAFPPFAFRRLLAAAPPPALPIASYQRPVMHPTMEDLAEYRPRLARSLQQILDMEGDVESTLCLDFVVETERYGRKMQVPLRPGGAQTPVTNANRREFVDLVIRYHLEVAVSRQFEPFKRGFYTVCSANALSMFRPEEIELLIRGSDEALDINSLRAVAIYENWGPRSFASKPSMIHSSTSPNLSANPTPAEAAAAAAGVSGVQRTAGGTSLATGSAAMPNHQRRRPMAQRSHSELVTQTSPSRVHAGSLGEPLDHNGQPQQQSSQQSSNPFNPQNSPPAQQQHPSPPPPPPPPPPSSSSLHQGAEQAIPNVAVTTAAAATSSSPSSANTVKHANSNTVTSFPSGNPEEHEPTLRWFWESFESASPADQRRLLSFITGSDRIPATGAASLPIKITCLGDDCGRYPIARTCFNMLQLHRYRSKARLEQVLWGAVRGSEGFGLK